MHTRIKRLMDAMSGKKPDEKMMGKKNAPEFLKNDEEKLGDDKLMEEDDEAYKGPKSKQDMMEEEDEETPEDEASETPEEQALEDKMGTEKHGLFGGNQPMLKILIGMHNRKKR